MKGSVFGLAAIGLLAACTLPEERQKPKTPAVVCPPEPPNKAMVLATIHEFHLANASFPFSRLGDVMDSYRPDMILVDTPADTLKGEHPEDASIELEYIKYIASTRSTDLVSIAPDREDLPLVPKPAKGDEDALAREAGFLSDPQGNNLTFEQANGLDGTLKLAAALNARKRYLFGDPDWVRREAWLEHSLDKVLDDKQPKRVLVIVDPINRAPVEAHLYLRGYGVMNPVKVVSQSKEKRDESAVPSAVLSAWSERLGALQARLHRLRPGADRSWLEYKVNVFQIAVDKHGSCCIALDMLQPPSAATSSDGDSHPIDRPKKPKR